MICDFSPEIIRCDKLSMFVGIFAAVFSLLSIIYSFGFMAKRKGLLQYYLCVILTAIVSLGVIFFNNLLLVMVCWGFLGILLYLLIGFGEGKRVSDTAKKAMIIIGGTDAFMLLGMVLLWNICGTLRMDQMMVPLNSEVNIWAYLFLASGAFAKAGAMPFHTWVPDTAEDAPIPVAAFLPASLDKLLGIYFLTRLSLEIFIMNAAMNTGLMALGSITIIAGVMMALVQHDFKRLLGYHAVSQVGYMVLGIGTGNIIGIAGGLFHMLNNAIYKTGLFFCGGIVEKKTGTTDLDKLGGLATVMPVTYITFLIASLAISGLPPLNGFASKWMIYQGIINMAGQGGTLWIIWLSAAMFGSALTLASFMKMIHAIFLGQPYNGLKLQKNKKFETGLSMLIPAVILSGLCIVFGVFVYRIPLGMFIFPSLKTKISFNGIWVPGMTTILILAGGIIGFLIYLFGTVLKTRQADVFAGGADLSKHPEMRVSGAEFYNTIKDIGILGVLYRLAEKKFFDIYEVIKNIVFAFNKILSYIHNGILSSYLSWCLLGMLILFYFLLG